MEALRAQWRMKRITKMEAAMPRGGIMAGVIVAALVLAGTPAGGHEQEQEVHSSDIAPRVGRMSDEVILQRLRLAGIEDPEILKREGDAVTARGLLAGRQAELEVETLSGKVFDVSNAERELIIGGAAPELSPMITGAQITVDREDIADPALMRNAVLPEQ